MGGRLEWRDPNLVVHSSKRTSATIVFLERHFAWRTASSNEPPNLSAARPTTPTMYHTITPLLLRRVLLAVICATGTLSAKNPPHPAPTPDPALELSPTQDDQIQRINNLFAQKEKPLSDALKKARKDYKRAINAHPVDNATVQEKAAAVQKAAALVRNCRGASSS